MNIQDFIKVIKNRRWAVLLIIAIFLVMAVVAILIQPLKYEASSRLLIIQENPSTDFYTMTKSNQYLGSLLTETVASGSFYDLVSAANPSINWGYFGQTYKQQVMKWEQTVEASSASDAAIIQINVYHPDPEQARQIALAVDNLLVSPNGLFQNSANNIKLKIIDQPIVSTYPVKPNITADLIGALALGLLFGLIYVYYFPVRRPQKTKLATAEAVRPAEAETAAFVPPLNYYHRRESIPVSPSADEHRRNDSINPEAARLQHGSQNNHPAWNGNIRNIIN